MTIKEVCEELMPADPERAEAWLAQTFRVDGLLRILGREQSIRKLKDFFMEDVLGREYDAMHHLN